MNFRECRTWAVNDILVSIDKDYSIKKTFMLLGGMSNAVYKMKKGNMDMLGLSGCGESNCPGVFYLLDIDYEAIDRDKFTSLYFDETYRQGHIFVLLGQRDMLNTKKYDSSRIQLVGHSYFVVDRIENGRIYLKALGEANEYYMELTVFHQLNNERNWIVEGDFKVYSINIEVLKANKKLKERMGKTIEELFVENVKLISQNSEMYGDFGTVRYDGPQAYDILIEHLMDMLKTYEALQDVDTQKKYAKYIYFQLASFRKFIAAGSDGYYRTEFSEILNDLNFTQLAKDWDEISMQWRQIGRVLLKRGSLQLISDDAAPVLYEMCQVFSEIKELEMSSIQDLVAHVEHNCYEQRIVNKHKYK